MGGAAEETELNDTLLCYQAMGASISDSPEKLERLYQGIVEQCKKDLMAPDPAVRANAKASLQQVNEMYDRIKKSTTYNSMAKEYLKAKEIAASQERSAKKVDKAALMSCPNCNRIISSTSKKCPLCKAPILTPFEKLMERLFSRKAIMIYLLVVFVAVAIGGVVYLPHIKALVRTTGK